jgi:hypothetical protein
MTARKRPPIPAKVEPSKPDMGEINRKIKAALANKDRPQGTQELSAIAGTLMEAHSHEIAPGYMATPYIAPALAVIQQIATRGEARIAYANYIHACQKDFPVSLLYPAAMESLSLVCADEPAAWDMRGISSLLYLTKNRLNTNQDCSDQAVSKRHQKLCHLAIDIATAAKQAGHPDIVSRAILYRHALDLDIKHDNGLVEKTARQAREEAAAAIDNKNPDIYGISALLSTSVRLFQKKHCHKQDDSAAEFHSSLDLFFETLENQRRQHNPETIDATTRLELGNGYSLFSILRDLPPKYCAQQQHATAIAAWLRTDSTGPAPDTAWSVAQQYDIPPEHAATVFQRVADASRSSGRPASPAPASSRGVSPREAGPKP